MWLFDYFLGEPNMNEGNLDTKEASCRYPYQGDWNVRSKFTKHIHCNVSMTQTHHRHLHFFFCIVEVLMRVWKSLIWCSIHGNGWKVWNGRFWCLSKIPMLFRILLTSMRRLNFGFTEMAFSTDEDENNIFGFKPSANI